MMLRVVWELYRSRHGECRYWIKDGPEFVGKLRLYSEDQEASYNDSYINKKWWRGLQNIINTQKNTNQIKSPDFLLIEAFVNRKFRCSETTSLNVNLPRSIPRGLPSIASYFWLTLRTMKVYQLFGAISEIILAV